MGIHRCPVVVFNPNAGGQISEDLGPAMVGLTM